MAAGRPKKPTALKELQGTYRKDRALENEMMPAKCEYIPSPPDYLTDEGKLEWMSVCQSLLDLKMLHRVDLALLSAYCEEMSGYIEAVGEVRRQGAIQTIERQDGSEYLTPNPWVSIRNQRLSNATKLASQFGFTPAARTRIRSEADPKEDEFGKAFE